MHYANGREAKVGDLVRGKGYNLKYEFTGVLVSAQPEASACNCTIATMSHRCRLDSKILVPDIEYGQLDAFVAINPETGGILGIDGDDESQVYGDIFPSYSTARKNFEDGMDIGMKHAADVVTKLRTKMDSAANSLLDQAEAAIQGLRKAKNGSSDDEIKGEPV